VNLGFRWHKTVFIYDGTGDPRWDVARAARLWAQAGVPIVMDEYDCTGCVHVYQGDAQDRVGESDWTQERGSAVDCVIRLDPQYADSVVARHAALHEIGHALGLDHNPTYVDDSVMNPFVTETCHVDMPSPFDLRNLHNLYK
jgi:hypothetical protein